jgi:hypothetical protein
VKKLPKLPRRRQKGRPRKSAGGARRTEKKWREREGARKRRCANGGESESEYQLFQIARSCTWIVA